jgi:O-antigen ligase
LTVPAEKGALTAGNRRRYKLRFMKYQGGISATIASWLLFTATALAPLPFGSNQPAAVAFWCIVLGVCLVCSPVRELGIGQIAALCVAGLVVAAYALVVHEQVADHSWLGAAPNSIWHEAEGALGVPLRASVSIARDQPWFELGRPLVCILAILCGVLVGADYRRASQLLNVVAWSGSVYAVYGILGFLLDPNRILWREKEAYVDSVTGTFINRNTAAVYFGSCAIVCLLLLLKRVRGYLGEGPFSWQKLQHRVLYRGNTDLILPFALLFLCLAAMFMTRSRAGVILSLVAMVVAGAFYFRRDLPRRFGLIALLVSGAALAVVLFELMGGGVDSRFGALRFDDQGRLATWRATLRMLADHPWLGTGEGTFVWSFPPYRSGDASMQGVWDHAHNTLLELAADMGIPLAALVAAVWGLIFVILIRLVWVRRRDVLIPTCALSVAMLANLHSLVDFSLQIPGYSIPALALVGAGLARGFAEHRRRPLTEAARTRRLSSPDARSPVQYECRR